MAVEIGRRSIIGQRSVRKIAMPRPSGTAINMAMAAVIKVPTMGAIAP